MARLKIIAAGFAFWMISPHLLYSQTGSFTSFEVQPCAGQIVVIQWSFAPGDDSLPFEVERSRDAVKWERIGHLEVQSSHQYFSIDTRPGDGLLYYRIRQAGSEKVFTTAKWVQISKDGDLYIWPNPAKDVLHVRTPFVKGSIDIIDPGGRLLMKFSISAYITDVPIISLAKGIYFMHARSEEATFIERFIKE